LNSSKKDNQRKISSLIHLSPAGLTKKINKSSVGHCCHYQKYLHFMIKKMNKINAFTAAIASTGIQ
jgi:hypothetical protein